MPHLGIVNTATPRHYSVQDATLQEDATLFTQTFVTNATLKSVKLTFVKEPLFKCSRFYRMPHSKITAGNNIDEHVSFDDIT